MAKRKGGYKRKTRYKLSKSPAQRGRIPIRRTMQTFQPGDQVHLILDPSVHQGIFYPRFHGMDGTITGTQGSCMKVALTDGRKQKTILAHPAHLRKVVHG